VPGKYHPKAIILSFLLCLCLQGITQPVIATSNSRIELSNEGTDITGICLGFIDSTKSLSINQVFEKKFTSIDFSNGLSTPYAFAKYNIWLNFSIENTGDDTLKVLLITNRNDRIKLYTGTNAGFSEKKAGFGYPDQQLSDKKIPYGFVIAIAPHKTETYYLTLENFFRLMDNVKISLFGPIQYEHFITREAASRYPILIFQYCFLACMLFMFLFTILQFSSNYYRGYVYYALFILFNFFIFLRLLEYNSNLRMITSFVPQFFYCFENLLTAMALIFYLNFIAYFLETQHTQGYFHNFIRIAVIFLFSMMALDLVIIIERPYAYGNISFFAIGKALNYSILLAALVQVFFNKTILARYIIIGTIALLLGIVYASYLAFSQTVVTSALMIPSNFAETGVILEILFFSVGLGHKSRVIEREKNKAQDQLITQLQENQKLQLLMNEKLEEQVKKRTDEVLGINKHFEEQRIRQIQSDFQKKIIETEMAALRAQMNPHFIFNCLNSINLFILKSEPEIASDYLTKFSRLIRLVLDNSRSQLVTLSNEITAIKLYIEMEALRFANKFGYEIIVDDTIDIENTEIPPMLLQPYVENAIWHGLMQYNGEGKITLLFARKDNTLIATIEDNGIGRDMAQRMKSKSATEHKSHGMKVTAERIDMINRIYDTQAKLEIIDKLGDTGIAFGTKVKIEIPLKKKN
jgi:sensor histidine kinase YesM